MFLDVPTPPLRGDRQLNITPKHPHAALEDLLLDLERLYNVCVHARKFLLSSTHSNSWSFILYPINGGIISDSDLNFHDVRVYPFKILPVVDFCVCSCFDVKKGLTGVRNGQCTAPQRAICMTRDTGAHADTSRKQSGDQLKNKHNSN